MPDVKCNVIIDSCCDLPREVIDVPGVELLRFPYLIDGEEHFDDMFASMPVSDFYNRMRKGAEVSTAQIPIPVITEMFERAIESGVPTVYLGFSSGLSGTFGTISMIRDQLIEQHPDAELYVVDTKLASIAEGLLVFEAIRQRSRGLTARELADWAEEARFYVNDQFTLDELNTLANYETNYNDYVRTNLIKWLMTGGVSDSDWMNFKNDLNGKVNLPGLQKVYQDAYDRYNAEN